MVRSLWLDHFEAPCIKRPAGVYAIMFSEMNRILSREGALHDINLRMEIVLSKLKPVVYDKTRAETKL